MAHRVVCISFSDGSGGAQVARRVASGLGFRVVDEAIVLRAAREAGVDRELVADAERRQSLVKRVLNQLSTVDVGNTPPVGYMAATGQPLYGDAVDQATLRDLIRAAIEETAAEGDAVIAAHAASAALAGRDDVLRVLVTGSPEVRAERIAQSDNVDAGEAAKAVERGDAARSDYLRRFYGVRNEAPTAYDLVVNTDRLSEEDAARLIVEAARP
jgi:cytidylate kinase